MINCPHCHSSNDMELVSQLNGIQESYHCSACGCDHFKHDGISVTDYNGSNVFDIKKLMGIYYNDNL